jgi:hypothetical protein
MRVRSFLALAAVATMTAVGFGSVPSASAATTVQLTVADMYTYSATSPLEKVICIDDVAMTSGAPDVHAPIPLAAGDHHVEVFIGSDTDCNQGSPNIDETVTLTEAPHQTLLLFWPSNSGPQLSVLVDDLSCPATGTGRVVYRPGAAVSGDFNTSLGYSDFVPWVEDVERGDQGAAEVAPGTYGPWAAVLTDLGTQVVDGPASGDVAAAGTIFVYTYGGNDGDTGMLVLPEIACTPVVPLTPLTPAPAAQPIAVTPLFTG